MNLESGIALFRPVAARGGRAAIRAAGAPRGGSRCHAAVACVPVVTEAQLMSANTASAPRRLRIIASGACGHPLPGPSHVSKDKPLSATLRLGALDLSPKSLLTMQLPALAEKYGGFYEIWEQLFEHARAFSTSVDLGGVHLQAIELVRYSPIDGHYPTAAELDCLDGLVISGSGEDSWNNTPWLVELRKKIAEYDAAGVKMSGFSFAPQVIAESLVRLHCSFDLHALPT